MTDGLGATGSTTAYNNLSAPRGPSPTTQVLAEEANNQQQVQRTQAEAQPTDQGGFVTAERGSLVNELI